VQGAGSGLIAQQCVPQGGTASAAAALMAMVGRMGTLHRGSISISSAGMAVHQFRRKAAASSASTPPSTASRGWVTDRTP